MINFAEFLLEKRLSDDTMLTHRNRKASEYEQGIADKLIQSGHHADDTSLEKVAGFHPTAPDFKFKDNKGNHHNLEIKSGTSSMFGQIALAWNPNDSKWEVSSKSKSEKPETASYIERSGLLTRLTHHWGDPTRDGAELKDLYHDAPNGAEGVALHYGADKNTPYIQVKGHGLFHTHDDPAKLGTPKLDGKFRLRARMKQTRVNANGIPTFQPLVNFTTTGNDLKRSHLSLDANPYHD